MSLVQRSGELFEVVAELQPTGQEQHWLGRLGGNKDFVFVRQLDDAESGDLATAMGGVSRYFRRRAFLLVEQQYRELLKVFKKLSPGVPDPLGEPVDPEAVTFDVSTRLALWLESFRIFLNTTETEIKRRHGAGSEIDKQWTFWKGDLFDRFMSYRLFYHLRNRQHEALPPIWFTSQMRYDADQKPMLTVEVDLDPQELLRQYSGWPEVVRQDLASAGSTRFELLPLVEEHQKHIQKLATTLMFVELSEVLKDGKLMFDYAKEAMGDRPDSTYVPVVFRIDANASFPNVDHVSVAVIEPEKLVWLQQARRGNMVIQGDLEDV